MSLGSSCSFVYMAYRLHVEAPKDWSIYRQPVHLKSDIKGWHNAINQRFCVQCGLPLYFLIKLLHTEVKLTTLAIRLVSDRKLKRIERLRHINMCNDYGQ